MFYFSEILCVICNTNNSIFVPTTSKLAYGPGSKVSAVKRHRLQD